MLDRNYVYALLDFDGYIAKSFYSGWSEEDPTNFDECLKIMANMQRYAYNKMKRKFPKKNVGLIKVISGHSFKKDLYPSYKAQRPNDDFLEMYRELVKEFEEDEGYRSEESTVIIASNLEADDVLVQTHHKHEFDSVVFSDDKDLHKYCRWTCKLAEEEKINEDKYGINNQLIQMIAGDTVDNIKGIPNFGEGKAKKYLDTVGYTLKNVIRLYKTREITADECLKNLILVTPVCLTLEGISNIGYDYIGDIAKYDDLDESEIHEEILSFIKILSKQVKEVYNEKDKQDKQSEE